MAGTMSQGQDRPERQDVGARLTRGARDYWMVLRRHRVILFVTMALCLLAALLYILLSTPDYRATASVEVEDVPAGAAGAAAMARFQAEAAAALPGFTASARTLYDNFMARARSVTA